MKETGIRPRAHRARLTTAAHAGRLTLHADDDTLRKFQLTLLPIVAGIALMVAATVKAQEIAIFTTSDIEITGIAQHQHAVPDTDVRRFRIDAIDQIENRLSLELPGDPEQSRKTALKRLQALAAIEEENLREAAEGLVLAHQLGVTRIPAIVFNQSFVIYGVTDLDKALALFNSRQGNPE